MPTSSSSTAWLTLYDEKKHDVDEAFGQGYSPPTNIVNESSFRCAFEALCRKNGEHKFVPLEVRLLPSYKTITSLAHAVSQSITELQQIPKDKSLEGLLWLIGYATIEYSCKAGIQLRSLATLLNKLNTSVPPFFTGDIVRLPFPNEERVQKPLQDAYGIFIDSYLYILAHVKKKGIKVNPDIAQDHTLAYHIVETGKRLEEVRCTYDHMVSQAADDKEREHAKLKQPRLSVQLSQPSVFHANGAASSLVNGNFVYVRRLGKGSFGDVDEVREVSTGVKYARKHIHVTPDKLADLVADEVRNEVSCMQKLRHLHIASVLFYFEEENAFNLFMLPVADYDLDTFMNECIKKEFPASLTKQMLPWFGCLLDALAYAHELEIKHQDIKPGNILIKNNQPFLSDFGLANDFSETNVSDSRGPNPKGTLRYRAPEKKPNKKRGRKADVFALGCVYSEMFTITKGKSLDDYRKARGESAFRDSMPKVEEWLKWLKSFQSNKLHDLLVDLILNMVKENDGDRYSAEQALEFLKPEPVFFCVEH